MNIKNILLALTALWCTGHVTAADDYTKSPEFLALRDSMHHAFNDGDSVRFFPALTRLQEYLLAQNDLHAYYTQRCNEIVFLMNRQRIFEAYKAARALSAELREKKIEKEMYMPFNMLGHINRYCGNKEEAKENWRTVLKMMEKEGYYANMPPIYMNIVNVAMDDSPEEADSLLEIAKDISKKYSPERVFDIETRQSLSYYYRGDYDRFIEGYKAYKEGVRQGKSSVNGRSMDVYYLALQGKTDEALKLAQTELGDDSRDAIVMILEKAGRWEEAYKALKEQLAAKDSIDNVVLSNSMEGIRVELRHYDLERRITRARTIGLTIGVILLALLVAALSYIVFTRRKHLVELKQAYNHALESDRLKTAFIQNVSHEIRTPLNIISGFAQVISDPELAGSEKERQHMSKMMQKNCHQITSIIDEMLELSVNESGGAIPRDESVLLNSMLRDLLQENQGFVSPGVELRYDSTLHDEYAFMTNKTVLMRAVNTLIDNAIKNTTEGTITLKTSADGERLQLAVEDTGKGIPAEEAEHIFERFVKLDDFKEGLGLGLPLCRKLAERLGGQVFLDTTYKGPGARFVISLPLGN